MKRKMQEQSSFYLGNVLKNFRLNRSDVASAMFPSHEYPDLALRRVLDGKSRLSVDQLEALARHLGASVQAVYEAGCNTWHDNTTGQDSFCVKRGVYTARYIYATCLLTVTESDKVIFNDFVDGNMLVQELMNTINNIIDGTYSN